MEVSPSLAAIGFDKLSPGDLFIYGHENGLSVAMLTLDPTNSDKLILPLGPTFPPHMPIPTLYLPRGRIAPLSFGAQYSLRLPASADGWTSAEPELGNHCLLVAEEGFFPCQLHAAGNAVSRMLCWHKGWANPYNDRRISSSIHKAWRSVCLRLKVGDSHDRKGIPYNPVLSLLT